MPDDKTQRGGQDRQRVNMHEEYEVRDWCAKLGCTKEQLAAAVSKVGDRADAVETELKRR